MAAVTAVLYCKSDFYELIYRVRLNMVKYEGTKTNSWMSNIYS